jgi:hypothetical protein
MSKRHTIKEYRGCGSKLHAFHNSAKDEGKQLASRSGSFAFPDK